MRGSRCTRRAVAPLLLAVGLLACTGDDGPLDPVGLEGIGDDDAEGSDAEGSDAEGSDAEGSDAEADDRADAGAQDVDATEAEAAGPGVIDLAGAGTVRVEVVDGMLRLQAIEPAEGWRERSRQVGDDEVAVELVRDAGGELDLDVELDEDRVQVSWQLALEPIGEGTIPLGDAGELVVSVSDGQLVLEELRLAPGWEVDDEDLDDDDIELELSSGEATLTVDVELDDRVLSLTLEHESSSSLVDGP